MNLQNNGKENNTTDKLTTVLFIIYLVALCWILLFKLSIGFSNLTRMRNINLIPFSEPLILNGKKDVGEIILNVIVFVPLGIYAGILFKKWTIGKKLFLFFSLSLLFEALQFIFWLGASDITDIITNTAGGIIGLMIFLGIEKLFDNSLKAQKFINIIAATGTVIMISLLLLLKMNMLPVRYR